MKKLFVLLTLLLSAQAFAVTEIPGTGVYQWSSTNGLIIKAKTRISNKLKCNPNQGQCTAVNGTTYRAHFNIRTGPGHPPVAHVYVDCTANNQPGQGHLLILSCSSSNIGWNICPIHVSQNK